MVARGWPVTRSPIKLGRVNAVGRGQCAITVDPLNLQLFADSGEGLVRMLPLSTAGSIEAGPHTRERLMPENEVSGRDAGKPE